MQLLKKTHEPLVTLKPSGITNAGNGVFSRIRITTDELPVVLCLYPGIFTPPPPIYAIRDAEYIANELPPSYFCNGIEMDNNAYIMNLQGSGGYIDACVLKSQYCETSNLDSNPSACGHIVNHDANNPNTEVFDFCWADVLLDRHDEDDEPCYQLPNEMRADGKPWFFDKVLREIVSFPEAESVGKSQPFGAALVATQPLDKDDELLLDYKLTEPYPSWAKDWYNQTEDAYMSTY